MNYDLNHLAIIMDGNGRWATNKGLSRKMGHYYGLRRLTKIAESVNKKGIKTLTVYAFSTENWSRPQEEVDYLMKLPTEYLNNNNFKKLITSNIKVVFIGRRNRFNSDTLKAIEEIELKTNGNTGLLLQICFDYGSQDEIITAANKSIKNGKIEYDDFVSNLYCKEPVDFLIRTSGEQRLSNFLMFQLCYAELYFTKKLWPAFSEKDLVIALEEYQNRTRRYGGLK